MDRIHFVTAVAPALNDGQREALLNLVRAEGGELRCVGELRRWGMDAFEVELALPGGADPLDLKRALFAEAEARGFEVALQPEAVRRRRKRLAVFDMDSTLVRIEVIDELARAKGVAHLVAPITARAMRGELSFDESLRARVALLEGLASGVLEAIASSLPLSNGAETLIRELKEEGCRVAVLSGGFDVAVVALQQRLGLDHAFSNTLEVRDGRLSGQVLGAIVDGDRKLALLQSLMEEASLDADEVIAVGDGANDRLMIQRAGLGVAYHAKPLLRGAADAVIATCGLDAVLPFVVHPPIAR